MCSLDLADFASIATIIGACSVPFAILFYLSEKRKERHSREIETFNSLSQEWREFLKLSLEYPELINPIKKTEAAKQGDPHFEIRNTTMYEILISMFESAFWHYHYHSIKLKESHWDGWKRFINDWLEVDSFRNYYCSQSSGYYSKEFSAFFSAMAADIESKKQNGDATTSS